MKRIPLWLPIAIGLFLSAVMLVTLHQFSDKPENLTAWNIYQGEIPGYKVEIDESRIGNSKWVRIVHAKPIGDLEKGITWSGVVGHDYEGRFTGIRDFDRVFRCGYPEPKNGCNSVVFLENGERLWKPCDADRERVKPFTDTEVEESLSVLQAAMKAVYDEKHLVSTLESWRNGQAEQTKGSNI